MRAGHNLTKENTVRWINECRLLFIVRVSASYCLVSCAATWPIYQHTNIISSIRQFLSSFPRTSLHSEINKTLSHSARTVVRLHVITSCLSIYVAVVLPLGENKALRMVCPWKQTVSLQTCMVISFLLAVFFSSIWCIKIKYACFALTLTQCLLRCNTCLFGEND